MLEQTIESTFTSRDWHETHCAHCCEFDSCVSMADVPTCFHCLERYYDEEGEPIELNVYQPETIKTGLHDFIIDTLSDPPRKVALGVAVVLAMIPLGSVIGSFASFAMVIAGGLR